MSRVSEDAKANVKNYVTMYLNGEIALLEVYLILLDHIEDDAISEEERDLWYNQYGIMMEQVCIEYLKEHCYEKRIIDGRYKWIKAEEIGSS